VSPRRAGCKHLRKRCSAISLTCAGTALDSCRRRSRAFWSSPAAWARISTTWDGAAGAGGFFERLFAPRVMQGIYADALERLNAYARKQAA
jgi:hypothetical protein